MAATGSGGGKLPPRASHSVQDDRGVLSPCAPRMGPLLYNLQTGELKVNICSRPRARGGRELVKVRIIGDRSFGWTEAAHLWGAQVEIVVHRNYNNHALSKMFNQPESCDVATASRSFNDTIPWDGILLATAAISSDAKIVDRLFSLWQPLIAILAFPLALNRAQRASLVPS